MHVFGSSTGCVSLQLQAYSMYMTSRCMPGAAGSCMCTSRPGAVSCPGRLTAAPRIRHAARTRHRQQHPGHIHASWQADMPMGSVHAISASTQTAATTATTVSETPNNSTSAADTTVVDSNGQATSNCSRPTSASHAAELPAKALLQAVTYSATHTLPPQPHWQAAVAALTAAVTQTAQSLSQTLPASTSSGVLRFEVPLPRSSGLAGSNSAGFTALQWLQGQEVLRKTLHQVYFSGRHSTAPDTPGTAAAEAAAEGWGAVSGLGAAWVWQGAAQQGFDSGVMSGVQRFLSEGQPRLRILGGSR